MAYKLMIRFTSIINGLRVSKLSPTLKFTRTDMENSEIIKLTNKDRDLFLKSIEKKISGDSRYKRPVPRCEELTLAPDLGGCAPRSFVTAVHFFAGLSMTFTVRVFFN